MRLELANEIVVFLHPPHLYSRQELLATPSLVPKADGVYGWWFRCLPAPTDTSRCANDQGFTLLYTGISPKEPPKNGRPPSKGNLRKRLHQHYVQTAAASTLRRTLGCLLADDLGLQLRRVGSGHRRERTNFASGEQALSEWMEENAFVSWVERKKPWELEHGLIRQLDLPLNLLGNSRNRFHPELTEARARCLAQARALPVLSRPSRSR
jgi:hypothetical protein